MNRLKVQRREKEKDEIYEKCAPYYTAPLAVSSIYTCNNIRECSVSGRLNSAYQRLTTVNRSQVHTTSM